MTQTEPFPAIELFTLISHLDVFLAVIICLLDVPSLNVSDCNIATSP